MSVTKLVCSRYVKIIRHRKKKIVFHSLYGCPFVIDDDVEQLLLQLYKPTSLKKLIGGSKDSFSALKDLVDIGFVLQYGKERQEYQNWIEDLNKKTASKQVFSNGIIFMLTTGCNLSCSYCICSYSLKKKQSMTSKTAQTILEWYIPYLKKKGNVLNPLFIFSGGEPCLQINLLKEITEFIENQITHLKPHFRVISNGTLFSRQIADYLENHNFDLIVSMDKDPTVHNNQRPFADGKPTWAKIWEGISLFSGKYRENNLSLSSVYQEGTSPENEDVLLGMMAEYGIFYWTINLNNLTTLINPKIVAQKIIALRQYAKNKYGIVVSGRWATSASNMRAGIRNNSICSASGRNRIFFQPDGSITFCDYDPRIQGNINKIDSYTSKIEIEAERYCFGNWTNCHNCMIEGFCSPCVLEEEVLHSGNPDFQKQKCIFLRECFRLLLFE